MAAASASTIFMLIFVYSVIGEAQEITLGQSLSTKGNLSWSSTSGNFAFGFYNQSDGLSIGIRLVGKEKTIMVWTADRDNLFNMFDATLTLISKGILLENDYGEKFLVAVGSQPAAFASMHNDGNFVLLTNNKSIVWQSFDYPTDTLLGGQKLFAGGNLYSGWSETAHSNGLFHLEMKTDGNLVLYPSHTPNSLVDSYWSSGTSGGNTTFLYMDPLSLLLGLVIGNSSKWIAKLYYNKSGNTAYNGSSGFPIYRATLDVDGVFRLYSHSLDGNGELTTEILWEALGNACEVKSFCGFNSYCTFNDYKPYCQCLLGTDRIDDDQRSGCRRNSSEQGCIGGKENDEIYNITVVDHMTWGDRPYFQEKMTIEECKVSCMKDCNCGAALFDNDVCMKQSLPLRYINRTDEITSKALVKVVEKPVGKSNSSDQIAKQPPVINNNITTKTTVVKIILLPVSFVLLSGLFLAIAGIFIYKYRVLKYQRLLESGNSGFVEDLELRLFSYNDLRKATNGFKQELGKGSFGAVYKGSFHQGKKLVAVKRLEKVVEDGEREFQAEMRTIGRAHHKNLVTLLGYCIEDSKRLLVYDYMANGSLADLLFRSQTRPNWNERVRIGEEVAKGLLYLHEECETPIIHCDIKPQNILMDDFWTARISDFGLAKLLMPDQTRTFTAPRGTRGYSAPEWQKNIPISLKVDVYSYGIVLLEIVCCRRIFEVNVSDPEKIILYSWVYKCFVKGQLNKIVNGEEVEKNVLEKLVKVALWCVQDEPALRPSMKSVVLMLQGITDIAIPPCPTSS